MRAGAGEAFPLGRPGQMIQSAAHRGPESEESQTGGAGEAQRREPRETKTAVVVMVR